mmetsp:Transcript_47606/g.111323  ORF Transcript_47606/g.111323 Transcript_47606/m.111323 type:complete len:138 (-) Transcript_47606:621-1034(-)
MRTRMLARRRRTHGRRSAAATLSGRAQHHGLRNGIPTGCGMLLHKWVLAFGLVANKLPFSWGASCIVRLLWRSPTLRRLQALQQMHCSRLQLRPWKASELSGHDVPVLRGQASRTGKDAEIFSRPSWSRQFFHHFLS